MRQLKRLSPDQIQNKSYVQTSTKTGLTPNKEEFLDKLSDINPTYKGEYSPAPVNNTASAARRVDFGEAGFNERLGKGMTPENYAEDVYYNNQGGFETAAKFVGHAASGAVTKAIGGIAALGSLVGEGGLSLVDSMLGGALEKIGYDGEFNWDDATDNPITKGIETAEKFMNEELFKVYQPHDWNEKNFFQQVTDGAWWGNEGADGVAFALSNFIPAAMLSKVGIGARAMAGLADMAEMTSAGKYLTAGRAGLLRGASIAEKADRAVSTAFMTASESIFEAKDTGDTLTQQYLQNYNQQKGTNLKSIEELQEADPTSAEDLKAKKGDAMKHTFFANMAALSASNWIEAGLLNKMMGKGSKGIVASEINTGEKFLDPIARVERKGLDKFFNNTRVGYTAKTIGQQMVTEGLYEENIQHAIQNVSQNLSLNGKIDNMKYIEQIGEEFFTNLGDKEAWKSIGAGMVIGGMFGGVGASGIPGVNKGSFVEKEEAIKNGVTKLNEISNNLRNVGQIYKQDGTVDTGKLQNYIANLSQAKNIQAIHDHYKGKGENELAEIVKNEHIANYVKGFMEVGLKDDLLLKMKDLQKTTDEDLSKWGFDPMELNEDGTQTTVQQRFKQLEDKVKDYTSQYEYLSKVIPSNERARQGEALSWYARYQHLDGLKNKLKNQASNLGADVIVGADSIASTINSLARDYANKLAELPNQERFSLPIRSAKTRQELLLIEKEITRLKTESAEDLGKLGITVTPGVETIQADETPKVKQLDAIKRTLTQVENAQNDAKDNYDGLVDVNGGQTFYESLANKVNELDEEQENSNNSSSFNEGDYLTVTDANNNTKSGFVTLNENGRLSFGNTLIDENFATENQVEKATEEDINNLKNQEVENYRRRQIEERINNVREQIDILSGKINTGEEFTLKQIIDKEDFILNVQNGTVRVSERQFAKQLKQIERTISDAEARLAVLEDAREKANNRLTELQYLYDSPETISDIEEAIARTEEEIVEVEGDIATLNPILSRLKSAYFSMLNLWKSLFPSKEYKSLEERALEIEDAIERGADPAIFEQEGAEIANKLSDYTEYKQDLQLTGAEMRTAQRIFDELEEDRTRLYGELGILQNRLAEYQLQANKFNYTKPLRPEVGQKQTQGNPPAKSKDPKNNPFNEPKTRDVSKVFFSTRGSHLQGDGLTTDENQLRWFKFIETINPKEYRLRTVTSNDSIYGLEGKDNLYSQDPKEYQNESHVKVVVTYKDGTPISRDGKLIFTSLTDADNFDKSKFTNLQNLSADKIEQMKQEYKTFLEKAKLEPQYLDITNRSNGIARKGEPISIRKAFGTEDVDLKLIVDSNIVGAKSFPLHEGLVYATANNRPVGLLVRKLNQTERDAAIARLKEYSKVRGEKTTTENGVSPQALLEQITSTFFLGERKGNPELSIFFIKGENNLAFGDNIVSHEDLQSGKYDVQLDQFLSNINHHVKNTQLNKKEEYRDITGKKWPTYKEYLISEREEAPLMSDLKPYSDDIREPQFASTYLEFSDGKKKEKVKESTGKGKKKFGSNLPTTVIGNGIVQLDNLDNNIPDPVAVVDEVPDFTDRLSEIPASIVPGTYASASSMMDDDYQEEDKEPKPLPSKKKDTSKAKEEVKQDLMSKFSAEDFEDDGEEINSNDKESPIIGSDSLFDFKIPGLSNSDDLFDDLETYDLQKEYEDSQKYDDEEDRIKEPPKKRWSVFRSFGGKDIAFFDTEEEAEKFIEEHNKKIEKRIYEAGIKNEQSFAKEKQWFRDNISSTIPFERVQGLVEEKAWGTFYHNGKILISNFAEAGTGYHEAFHAVEYLFLTEQEQKELREEWHKNNKVQDKRNSISSDYDSYNDDRIASEGLADEFAEFMLTNESPYKSWFQKILDFIKGIIGIENDSSKKKEVFERIKQGKYKNAEILSRKQDNKGSYLSYSIAKDVGASIKKQVMDGLTVTLFQNLYKTGFDIEDIKNFNKNNLGKEKMKEFKNLYINTYNLVLNDIKLNPTTQYTDKIGKEELLRFLTSTKGKLRTLNDHANTLQQFGVQFNLEQETDLNNLPEDEKGRDTLGIVDSIEFSTKNSMPNAVKILIASLPQMESKDGGLKPKRSDIGLLIPTDYRRNVSILHNELAGVSDFQEQMAIVSNLGARIPEMNYLVRKLNTGDATTQEGLFLQSQFRQQFDKNRYTFFMQLYDGENTRIIDANSSRMVDLIKARWQGELKNNGKSVKTVGGDRVLNSEYFEKKYSNLQGDVTDQVLSFYKELGITFSSPEKVNIDKLADVMSFIMTEMEDRDLGVDLFDQDGIKGNMLQVVEEEVKTSLDYSDNQHISPAGKTVYNISLNDYNSIIINEMNRKGIPTHLQWNEETQTGNPLARNSTWLDKIKKGKKLATIILEGGKLDETYEQGKLTSDMTRGEAAIMQFASIMRGFVRKGEGKALFPFLRAGDKALEKGFTFGEGLSELTLQEATNVIGGYLADEMLSAFMLNVEGVGADIDTYKTIGKGLRIFEGVLNKADEKKAVGYMNSKLSRKQTIAKIDEFVKSPSVMLSIQNYLDTKTKDNIQELVNNKVIFEEDGTYTNIGLPTEIVQIYSKEEELSKGVITNMVGQFTYQSLIANIEQTKMFTGDIAFFKDFFKRTSGLVGTGKTAWVGQYIDKMLNNMFPRADKKSDSNLETWVYNDVIAASQNFDEYIEAYKQAGYTEAEAKDILSSYNNNTEADAQGYVTLPEYREFNLRMGDWNNEREEVYQKALAGVLLDKSDMQMLNPEKPQMYAPQNYDEIYAPAFYKLSILPLIPSLIKGRTLEKMNEAMLANSVGMALFISGNKVGARNVRPFYNEQGTFNTSNTDNSHSVNYRYMKKQLDINPVGKDKVVFGTQFRKLVLSGLVGKSITIKGKEKEGNKIIEEYNNLIDKQIQLLTDKLVKKLGITKQSDDSYKITNVDELKNILQQESISRSAPDNMIESFDSIFQQGNVGFVELSVNRNKIEQLLMSLVNNNIIKQNVFGGSLVQAASTGFELQPRKQSDVTGAWASNLETLKFYQPTDGGTTAMEVYLPFKFKNIFDRGEIGKIDPRLRELIAFRIPTQGLNSIEAIKVKGFLPREAGDIVIVPTEGVTKSGWDFDVDKLNVFYPAYESTKEDPTPKYIEYDANNPTEKGIQNRIIELSRQIVLSKENFVPLTTPNTTKDLEDMIPTLTSLNPELKRDEKQRNRFVDWAYNLGIRETYLSGKSGVGQAALQNVNHVMAQIAGLKMKLSSPINLKHHADETGNADLSKERDVDNNRTSIQDIISQSLNGFVDAANNPFLKVLGITPTTSNAFFFMVRIGTPIKQAILLLNQPSVRDYIRELDMRKVLYKEEVSKAKVIEQETSKYSGISEDSSQYPSLLTEAKLASYIKNNDKTYQGLALAEFLNIDEQASKLADLIKAVNFDTTNSASIEGARTKLENYLDLKEEDVFINMDAMLNQTFLGSFAKATKTSIDLYKDIFITEKDKGLRGQLNKLKSYVKNVRGLDLDKFMNTAKNDIMSFILQNSKLTSDPKVITKMGNFINSMFIDKTNNIPTRLALIQEIHNLGNNAFIRELVPLLSKKNNKIAQDTEDVNNIKMFTKRLTKEEQDLITDGWRELFEDEDPQVQGLATDLMIFAILQSGLNNSAISFTQFIPQEQYIRLANILVNNTLNGTLSQNEMNQFTDKFFQNNYKSNDIVPTDKYGKIQADETLVSSYNRPYIKKYNRKTKTSTLYRNTYENQGEKFIFVEAPKLGDGFNFKEYANNVSVLASNNIGQVRDEMEVEEGKTTKNTLISQIQDSDLNDKTKQDYIKRVNEAKNIKEVADIVKELCK